jgi:PAS domain S-box-containing protein
VRAFIDIRDRLLTWFGRANSKYILFYGFAIVILLGLLPTLYSQWAEDNSMSIVNRFIDVDNKIADISLSSITNMIKVRRNEKDFLISRRDFGFEEAKARYITTLRSIIVEIKQNMKQIRALANDPEITQSTNVIDNSLDQYQAGIMASVELYGLRGGEHTGIESKIRSVAGDIEGIVRREKDERLLADVLSLRMNEKDFMINDLDSSALNTKYAADRLMSDLIKSSIAPDYKKALLKMVEAYKSLFGQYVQITVQLQTIKQAYLKSLQNVEPTLERLHALAVDNTYKARDNMKRYESHVQATTIASYVLAFFFSSSVITFVVWRIKVAEARLRVSETKYRTLFEIAPDAIIILNMSRDILIVNQHALMLLGYENISQLFGNNIADAVMPEDAAVAENMFLSLAATGSAQGVEFRMLRKDGSQIAVEGAASTISSISGNPESIIVAVRDITERRQAESERGRLIADLQKALADIKTLYGILHICASCKKIRDDNGSWTQMETYVATHTEADFSHGICPDCAKKAMEELNELKGTQGKR